MAKIQEKKIDELCFMPEAILGNHQAMMSLTLPFMSLDSVTLVEYKLTNLLLGNNPFCVFIDLRYTFFKMDGVSDENHKTSTSHLTFLWLSKMERISKLIGKFFKKPDLSLKKRNVAETVVPATAEVRNGVEKWLSGDKIVITVEEKMFMILLRWLITSKRNEA